MGKNAKDHRKKVEARNQARKNEQKKQMKVREEWLRALIDREKAAGKFDNVPQAVTDQNQIIGAPAPTLTEIQGPII
jgi:predicted alternative tryptophan synthase beta-subunit